MACQLACRIYDLKLIKQSEEPLCGPNVFIYALALSSISDYIELAIDLLEKGKARINEARDEEIEIEITNEIANLEPGIKAIDDIDLVVFGALRNSVFNTYTFLSKDPTIQLISGYTAPHQLMQWLRHAGYSEVLDHIIISPTHHPIKIQEIYTSLLQGPASSSVLSYHAPSEQQHERDIRANLTLAYDERRRGCLIFLLHDSNLSSLALRPSLKEPREYTADRLHWALINGLEVYEDFITIDILTWGKRSLSAFGKPFRIQLPDVMKYWAGFISAKP
jgi:hypothetical protein